MGLAEQLSVPNMIVMIVTIIMGLANKLSVPSMICYFIHIITGLADELSVPIVMFGLFISFIMLSTTFR